MAAPPPATEPIDKKGDARDGRLSGPKRLKHAEESVVRKQMTKDAITKCHETRDAYLACASGALSCASYIPPLRI